MATITFEDDPYALNSGETVLDGLLRQGVDVPNSCRAGACQSCLMRCTDGAKPPVASQQGLKDALKAQGFFLACQCVPAADLSVARADGVLSRSPATVLRVEKLSGDVARVLLDCHAPFEYRPGQFLHLVREDGLTRSYSLASQGKRDKHLELHVRKVRGGAMSNWLHDDVTPGHKLEVRGPAGDCFYLEGRPEQPILLAGTGTGLAPLYAIVRDAVHYGHTGTIRLYHGALNPDGLYLVDELKQLAAEHSNFTYIPSVLDAKGECDPAIRAGSLEQMILADTPSFAGWRVFLCGNPELVKSLRKKIFLAGAKMKEIYSDAFVMRAAAV
jgi:NAD(P)H-flavin reductase/ferredoxin